MWKYMVAAITLTGIALATAPFNDTVGTNSVQLVAKKPVEWTAWASNTVYAAGDVVKSSGYYYMALESGTSSNSVLTNTTGEASDGLLNWRQIEKNKRQGVVITMQTSGGSANLSLGTSPAVDEKGLKLVSEGHTLIFGPEDNYQGEIHAISSTTGNVVIGVQEY